MKRNTFRSQAEVLFLRRSRVCDLQEETTAITHLPEERKTPAELWKVDD
jgi:hypothetical protein